MIKATSLQNFSQNGTLLCGLCPKQCELDEGHLCRSYVRRNMNGSLMQLNYGQILALYEDDIPGVPNQKAVVPVLAGSNDSYIYDQDEHFSKLYQNNVNVLSKTTALKIVECSGKYYSPTELVQYALDNKYREISFSKGEPLMNIEYVLDVCKIAKNHRVKVSITTHGSIHQSTWESIMTDLSYVDLRLLSTHHTIYKKYFRVHSQHILDFCKLLDEGKILRSIILPSQLMEEYLTDEESSISHFITSLENLNTIKIESSRDEDGEMASSKLDIRIKAFRKVSNLLYVRK